MKPICIIDDDDDIRDAMTFALEMEGFTVQAFGDPEEAMRFLMDRSRHDLPGLIMVDYHMPKMDGVTFLNTLLVDHGETFGKIPMAICSAENDLGTNEKIPANVFHINKPMELDQFVATIRKNLKNS